MLRLPADSLAHALSFLSNARRLSCARVCSALRAAVRDPCAWRDAEVRLPHATRLAALLASAPGAHAAVALSAPARLLLLPWDDGPFAAFTDVRRLRIEPVPAAESGAVGEALRASGTADAAVARLVAAWPALASVTWLECRECQLTDAALTLLVQRLPALRALDLIVGPRVTAEVPCCCFPCTRLSHY